MSSGGAGGNIGGGNLGSGTSSSIFNMREVGHGERREILFLRWDCKRRCRTINLDLIMHKRNNRARHKNDVTKTYNYYYYSI